MGERIQVSNLFSIKQNSTLKVIFPNQFIASIFWEGEIFARSRTILTYLHQGTAVE